MKKNELQQEVRELVTTHLQQKKISQNKLAEMIGVSSGTISNIVNEVWERLNESMLLKIKSFFNTKEWNVIETYNYATIHLACKEAREYNKMISIIGYSGAGKTTALQYYYQKNTNTYLVTCGRSMRTKQLLSEILKALGISFLASDYEMIKLIIEELNKKESPLLIIDEASKLSPTALMYLQDIWDGIEDNAGILIAGVEYLLTNIKKGAEKNKIGMPEFYGRVSKWIYLQLPEKKEIEAICINNGLTNMELIKSMHRIGSFRLMRNVINNHLNTI
ncbi:AAA family ATPase [Flavobacterium restrictum]|uniref:AAA family ATPase n=1 Tax=Flavobacterium restrictum TaxID=2594428 RepID=A0A553E253_9FLAO|nr:AAA family ATPase [Flavobacterium restrictum]TRX39070.1 AAA family ATPase [Flavobacterium restrictum]